MSIVFECEQCHRRYQVADGLAGKWGRCKQCGHPFTIPRASGPTAAEIYNFEADIQSSQPLAEEPVRSPRRKKKEKPASGLYGLSALPLWGFNVYRGTIAALLVVALLVGGVTKFALAMAGMILCVGPFLASGFAYRFGVAFRDGLFAGLLYMFFVPYRIHYRLTHRELFQTLRAPSLTLRDFGLLLLGLCFLPVVILAAQDMDKRARNHPPEVDWARFGLPETARVPAPAAPKHHVKPPSIGLANRPSHRNGPPKPVPADRAGAGPDAMGPAPTDPAAPETPSAPVADAEPRSAQPSPGGPEVGGFSRFRRGPRPPSPPRSSMRTAAAPFGPEEAVTITVHGAADAETKQRLNKAIIAIVKPSSGQWRVSVSTIGDKTIFQAGPVTDPKAFADKIEFGKVTRVEGRSIDVEVGP